MASTYPKVDVQIATATKLPVTDLECDGHPILLVQRLVEAFSGVGAEKDIVSIAECEEGQ